MLEIDKNKVQINLGPNVGDMTIRHDPPRRGQVNHHGGLLKNKPKDYTKVKAYDKAYSRPKLRGGLRPMSINRHA